MAKTAKLKNATKPSFNSRSSRKRASSPSLTLDRTITNVSPPPAHRPTKDFLAPQHNASIGRRKAPKPLRRKQRLRKEQGKEKAENVLEKTEVKVLESVGRVEKRRGRKAKWEDIDEKIGKDNAASKRRKKEKTDQENGREEGDNWVDEGEDDEAQIAETERVQEAGDQAATAEETEEEIL
ncbi:MAG: hypothetical protein Q9163_005559 [Psora crenata]